MDYNFHIVKLWNLDVIVLVMQNKLGIRKLFKDASKNATPHISQSYSIIITAVRRQEEVCH